jgi:pimeloyl-ACP methyl ester carboxylesterase
MVPNRSKVHISWLKMIRVSTLVIIGFIFIIPGCSTDGKDHFEVPESAEAGQIIDVKPYIYERGGTEYKAERGTLIVPENRADSDSRLIALPVTRVIATGDSPGEPIFFLPGGPGLSNNGLSKVDWFIKEHDIVIVGYRGVDGSVRLDCPEVSEHIKNLPGDMLGPRSMENMTAAYARGAQRLQNEGVDLDGYTVVEVVDDLEAARLALGYSKINLYSISYGTRLAMIYGWRYPESLHRSAMIAVNPPGRMFYYDPAVIDRQLAYYAELCAGDPGCSAMTGNLAETMRRVSHNMPERWLGFPIDRGMIRAASFESLSDAISASKVFDVWLAAARGDYSGMALLTLAGPMMFANAAVWGDNIAKAASADFEVTRDLRAGMDLAGSILGSPRSELAAAAAGWPVNTIPAEYKRVQPSDVETLLVSGNIDFWTPMRFVEKELLPSLSRGQHVVVSNLGHAEMLSRQSEASARLLAGFFKTGEADDSLFVELPWEYNPGLGFPAIAKIAAAVILLLIGGLVFVLRFVIRRLVRKSRQ